MVYKQYYQLFSLPFEMLSHFTCHYTPVITRLSLLDLNRTYRVFLNNILEILDSIFFAISGQGNTSEATSEILVLKLQKRLTTVNHHRGAKKPKSTIIDVRLRSKYLFASRRLLQFLKTCHPTSMQIHKTKVFEKVFYLTSWKITALQ